MTSGTYPQEQSCGTATTTKSNAGYTRASATRARSKNYAKAQQAVMAMPAKK